MLIADERQGFELSAWLRARPPEPVSVSVITFSELWFGIEVEEDAARARRRRRWIEKTFRRLGKVEGTGDDGLAVDHHHCVVGDAVPVINESGNAVVHTPTPTRSYGLRITHYASRTPLALSPQPSAFSSDGFLTAS